MSRESTSSFYESPKGSGRWHGKFTTPRGRRSVRLHACRTVDEAARHKTFIVEQLERLNSAGQAARGQAPGAIGEGRAWRPSARQARR
jgi:hypothetical protein